MTFLCFSDNIVIVCANNDLSPSREKWTGFFERIYILELKYVETYLNRSNLF